MSTNRSTLHQWLEDAAVIYSEVKVIPGPGPVWRVYAVTKDGTNKDGSPKWPFLLLGQSPHKAAAGSMAAKFGRWIKEYYDA